MEIIGLTVGALATNCYLVFDSDDRSGLIIDPGDEANFISEKILQLNFKPVAIIATHGHFDHILAARELQLAFQIPFLIHQEDEKIVNYMSQSAQWWLKREIIEQPPKIDEYLIEGQTVSFGSEQLTVFHAPGHTPGSICLYSKKEKILFSGDVIFKDGIGRTDLPYSSPLAMEKSLKKIRQKLSSFIVYPGHGEKFYLSNQPL